MKTGTLTIILAVLYFGIRIKRQYVEKAGVKKGNYVKSLSYKLPTIDVNLDLFTP